MAKTLTHKKWRDGDVRTICFCKQNGPTAIPRHERCAARITSTSICQGLLRLQRKQKAVRVAIGKSQIVHYQCVNRQRSIVEPGRGSAEKGHEPPDVAGFVSLTYKAQEVWFIYENGSPFAPGRSANSREEECSSSQVSEQCSSRQVFRLGSAPLRCRYNNDCAKNMRTETSFLRAPEKYPCIPFLKRAWSVVITRRGSRSSIGVVSYCLYRSWFGYNIQRMAVVHQETL